MLFVWMNLAVLHCYKLKPNNCFKEGKSDQQNTCVNSFYLLSFFIEECVYFGVGL